MCADGSVREAVAADIMTQLSGLQAQLSARVVEWSIPGTSLRAVVGAAGVCKELLLSPARSIIVRLSAVRLRERLAEPIASIARPPKGFFSSLANPGLLIGTVSESEVLATLAGFGNPDTSVVDQKRISIPDLKAIPTSHIQAAVEYTRGPVCYRVNPFLRTCNEEECLKYAPYIKAMNIFHHLRSSDPRNRPWQDRVVYRGCPIPVEMVADYTTGHRVVWPSFTSTSTNAAVARAFGGTSSVSHTSMFFEITTPLFCRLEDISVYPGESEVLLPAFSTFTVTQVTTEGTEGTENYKRHIYLRYEPEPEPEPAVEDDSPEAWQRLDGRGPHIIRVDSTEEGDAGIVDTLHRHLLDLDPHLDGRLRHAEGRLWGRLTFTGTEAASRACERLNGSVAGDVQLSVQPCPVETESLRLQCRVSVMLTRVPHTGFCNITCGTAELAEAILQQATARPKGNWRLLALQGSGPVWVAPSRRKKEPMEVDAQSVAVDPATQLTISHVPPEWTVLQLIERFRQQWPLLPPNAVRFLSRERVEMQREAKALRQTGLSGVRARIEWLRRTVGDEAPDLIQEVHIGSGAVCHLWCFSVAQAREIAARLDGAVMPDTQV